MASRGSLFCGRRVRARRCRICVEFYFWGLCTRRLGPTVFPGLNKWGIIYHLVSIALIWVR